MSPLDQIRGRLAKYPQASIVDEGESIVVRAAGPEEFDVAFEFDPKGSTVRMGGWYETFANQKEALACFGFALSAECRLKVASRGSYDYRWTVQGRREGEWTDDATRGKFFCPFWRKREERFLQNRLWERLPDSGAPAAPCQTA